MEQRSRIEKQPEGRAKPTGKAEKVGLGPWHRPYIYQQQTGDQRELHGDPRSEQSHGQHHDSDLISSDGDPEFFHPASGIGATPDLHASASSASDSGTLAGWRGQRLNDFYTGRVTDVQHTRPPDFPDPERWRTAPQ